MIAEIGGRSLDQGERNRTQTAFRLG